MDSGKINVLVVDDSATVRQVLAKILLHEPAIASVETASDPIFAMQRMVKQRPHVIILDIEMPRMDGITFLKKIMSESPIPVVICSSLTDQGAELTIQAMQYGAVEIITKPKLGVGDFLQESAKTIAEAVKSAARSNLTIFRSLPGLSAQTAHGHGPIPSSSGPEKRSPASSIFRTTDKVIAIGASTGGTTALEEIFRKLPVDVSGIVVVQHMPEKFTAAFAERLDRVCAIDVKEAKNGESVHQGKALIAPGNRHMQLLRSGAHYIVEVREGPIINHHRPSVDVLFRSVARSAGKNALGVILTGMGNDGTAGMEEMHQAGSFTVAQDESTSVVFGMPKEAIKRGVVDRILPLHEIPAIIAAFA